jgi:hypothetical protein
MAKLWSNKIPEKQLFVRWKIYGRDNNTESPNRKEIFAGTFEIYQNVIFTFPEIYLLPLFAIQKELS